jgi:hypothetical protein
MNNLIDTYLISDIRDIICDYACPDYKFMYDAVVRDINWVAGFRTLRMFQQGELYTTPFEEFTDDEWDVSIDMIRCSASEKYERVLQQLHSDNVVICGFRFFEVHRG